MKKLLVVSSLICLSIIGFAKDATWIWYPGDYGIWQGSKLQSRRLERGNRHPPFWRLYEPYSLVTFRKSFPALKEAEEIFINCDGASVIPNYMVEGEGTKKMDLTVKKFVLPKGTNKIQFKIQNSARVPSLYVKGKTIFTDDTWEVSCEDTYSNEFYVPAETSKRFADGSTSPCLQSLATKEMKPKWVKSHKGNHLLADFGEETYGYLKLRNVKGSGFVKVIYAESEEEMMAEDLAINDGIGLDGWVNVEVKEGKEFRLDSPYGLRYVHLIPLSKDITIGDVALDYEWKDIPVRGSFRCSDEEINRIWDVSVKTLALTCREVFIEGIKRDHWVWSGDAVQSFLMNYYTFGDYDGCRDTLWTLRGKDPIHRHLNHIMDYSFYWFEAVDRYRMYTGDKNFTKQIYPRMKSMMEMIFSRLDKDGRPVDRPNDWMFVDWASVPLPNKGGVVSLEQMLFVRSLEAIANVANALGEKAEAEAYLARAKKLRDEIVPRYWNEEKGGLMHMKKHDGSLDPLLTRYPNMFGLFYGYFNEKQKERVIRDVMLNDNVLKIQTPYMRFYELEALCSLGMQKEVTKEIKAYWGDMLRLGATSFWELYNPNEKGSQHYAMYSRPFGRSLCHAWGASPVYLLGRYYLGVTPTSPGFETYEVKPNLGGLDWIEGDVPTPWGKIHVRADKNGHTVKEIRDVK